MQGYETLSVHIKGLTPTMQHNGQLADPLNKWAKAMKEITAKRKKTDADYEELARLEFMGGLYIGDDGSPCWPGTNVEGMLLETAKKSRQGKNSKAGVISDGNWPLIYKGPRSPDDLWADPTFRDVSKVNVKGNSIMRTRPIFRDWELKFEVSFLPDVVNDREIRDWFDIAGRLVGLSENRPKYGRFEVVSVE